jgi:pentatricopeptide repeat protein
MYLRRLGLKVKDAWMSLSGYVRPTRSGGEASCKQSGKVPSWGGLEANTVDMFNAQLKGLVSSNKLQEARAVVSDMRVIGVKPNCDTYYILVYAFCQRNEPESALQVVQDMGLPSTRSAHKSVFDIYVPLISCLHKNQQLERAVMHFRENNIQDPALCVVLISFLLKNDQIDEAMEFYRLAFAPSTGAVSLLLRAIQRITYQGEMYGTNHLQSQGIQDDHVLQSAGISELLRSAQIEILTWLVHHGDLKAAAEFYEEIEFPDAVQLNILLQGFVTAGDLSSAAELFEHGKILGIVNSYTYNILLKGYCKAQDWNMMNSLLEEMGDLVNVVTYNTVIHQLLQAQAFNQLPEILQDMKRRNMSANDVTCSSIVSGLAGHNVELAVTYVDQFVAEGVHVTRATLNQLLFELAKVQNSSTIERLISKHDMRNVSSWNSLISGSVNIGDMDAARRYFNKASGLNMHDAESFYSMVKGYIDARNFARAMKLVHTMREEGFGVDLKVFHCIVKSLVRKRSMKETVVVCEAMKKFNVKPDEKLMTLLINGWCKVQQLSKALEMYHWMIELGISPQPETLETLLKSSMRSRNYRLASYFIWQMEDRGIIPGVESQMYVQQLAERELNKRELRLK